VRNMARLAEIRGRRAAEALMKDACSVSRPTGATVTDPETGKVSKVLTPVWAGRCKVQVDTPQSNHPTAGEHRYTVQASRVDIPVTAPPVIPGDVIEITRAGDAPGLVGTRYAVGELFKKSYQTAQRLPVEEVTA